MFDTAIRESGVDGELIQLTLRKMALLEVFLLNRNQVMPHRYLENKLFAIHRTFESNMIEVHISGLQKKLGKKIIRTIFGPGYLLEDVL
ncbi:winged helix-turn-helix domain-containing protein [Enterobacter oligotrophicus]|uniref:winged helix-turn-helix domain-containing protein n=1 Tax=Enterobacter oligotrophicus TaxID=2478464 RepID=UPI0012607A3E|nr:winged helix-turn-helix domain-containing protein [Enterobacter oligotrophicus]